MIDKEFVQKLIDIRNECADTRCEDCRFTIDKYHNCIFRNIPCHWDELEILLKKERGYKE